MSLSSFFHELRADSLRLGSLYLMINAAGTSILGFIFWMFATRLNYTPDEIGVGAALINAMTLLSFLSIFGIQIGLLRFIPLYDKRESFSVMNSAFSLVILSSIIVGLGFSFTASVWSEWFGSTLEGLPEKLVFTLFVVFWSIHLLLNAVFIAKKHSKFVFLKDTVVFSAAKVALLFPFVFLGAFGILTAWGFGILFAVLMMWVLVLNKIMGGYSFRPSGLRKGLMKIVDYSLINYFGEIFRTLPTLLLPILTVHLVSPEDGGYFFIAWMIANVIFYMIYMFTLPIVVEGAEDINQLTYKLKKYRNLAIVVFIPGIILLLLFPDLMLQLVGGDEVYTEGTLLLRLLALSAAPFLINNILVAKSRIYQNKDVIWIYGLSSVITIILSIWWFQSFGIVGGGLAWFSGQIIVTGIFGTRELVKKRKVDNST